MTAAPTNRYRVCLHTWETYTQWIEAESGEEAVELALLDYENNGDENFKLTDGGIESGDIWNVQPIDGKGGGQ